MNINARKVALELLDDNEKQYINKLVQNLYKRTDIDERDKHFISKIVYGVVEQKIYLDFLIRKFSSVRLKKIDPSILNILRMSVYQILFMDKTPNPAVVDEAVKLAKKVSFRHKNFVNGLLRNFLRDGHKVQIPKENDLQYLSIKYSHPEWMVSRFIEIFGRDFAEDLMEANNKIPELTIRLNTGLMNREDYMTKLSKDGVEAKKSDIVEDGIIIMHGKKMDLEHNDDFKNGLFTVQDESSMKIAHIVDPQAREHILDLCAAPGGKSSHMAQLCPEASVTSCDVSKQKLDLIEENIARLKIENITCLINDATVENPAFINQFDKVLVDAPCSGLGIIRRKPDIKYHKTMEDIHELSKIQLTILKQASRYVKDSGYLIYSTCTLDPIENDTVIQKFLREHQEFERVLIDDNNAMQLYPNVNETDGFYCCKMKKK